MAFLRFVLANQHPDSGAPEGLFQRAYKLRASDEVAQDDRQLLDAVLSWFEQNLATPQRLNRTTSKGYYRRRTKGIAWFRDSAHECLGKMHELRRVVEAYGYAVELVREDRIGYITYEDPLQVVAEPFRETRAGRRG